MFGGMTCVSENVRHLSRMLRSWHRINACRRTACLWSHTSDIQDEGGLLPDSDGVVENDVVVGDGTCVNTCGLRQHQQQHSQRHRYRQDQPQHQQHQQRYQQRQEEELEDLLCFRGPPEEEMVAQEMAQSYTQLLHPGQEPQEFISLEELQPRIHQEHRVHDNRGQVVSRISSTGAQLYQPHHQQQQQQQQQQRSYYSLSAVQEGIDVCV